MPYIACDDGVSLHYRFDGPDDAPVLVMSNSLGTDLGMWEPQMPALIRTFRVLRYDTRGHGLSGLSPTSYGVDRLGRDVLALMVELEIGQAAFCGLSMGGLHGLCLGVHGLSRLTHPVLCH